MGLAAFDPDSSTSAHENGRGPHDLQRYDPGKIGRAVTDLLQNQYMSHTCGVQGEWEVRTTLVINRQIWRYQSRVYVHGKEARKSFPPVDVVGTRRGQPEAGIGEEALTAFVKDAVEVHFARCASVTEYAIMAAIFSQPPSGHRRMKTLMLILLGAVALSGGAAFWTMDRWWKPLPIAALTTWNQQPASPHVRWQTPLVSYQSTAGEPFTFPLPTLERMPDEVPVEVTLEASGDVPGWVQLDHQRLQLHGTAPATPEDQTYRLIVRAHTEQGSDSQLQVLLAIKGQPAPMVPAPRLPSHWAW